MCVAAITCQVVQSRPGKSGWNLWGLRISRGHVHTCLQIRGAHLGKQGGISFPLHPSLFVMVNDKYFSRCGGFVTVLLQSAPSPLCDWCMWACCVSAPQRWEKCSPKGQQVLWRTTECTQCCQSRVAATVWVSPDALWFKCQNIPHLFFFLIAERLMQFFL